MLPSAQSLSLAMHAISSVIISMVTTLTSSDPHFMRPEVKYLLRVKNRLMRWGRVQEASAVARRVGLMNENVTKGHRRNVDDSSGLEELWKKVGLITKRGKTHAQWRF